MELSRTLGILDRTVVLSFIMDWSLIPAILGTVHRHPAAILRTILVCPCSVVALHYWRPGWFPCVQQVFGLQRLIKGLEPVGFIVRLHHGMNYTRTTEVCNQYSTGGMGIGGWLPNRLVLV